MWNKKDFVIQFYLKQKYVFGKEMIFMDIKAHLSKKKIKLMLKCYFMLTA